MARFASDVTLFREASCVGVDGDEENEEDDEAGANRKFERRLLPDR